MPAPPCLVTWKEPAASLPSPSTESGFALHLNLTTTKLWSTKEQSTTHLILSYSGLSLRVIKQSLKGLSRMPNNIQVLRLLSVLYGLKLDLGQEYGVYKLYFKLQIHLQ